MFSKVAWAPRLKVGASWCRGTCDSDLGGDASRGGNEK